MSRPFSLSQFVGVVFLVSQSIFILQSHFAADSPRMLTPVEGLTRYELHATSAQRPLTSTDIKNRYGIASHDDSGLTVGAVRAAIGHREKSASTLRAMYVRLRTRGANGAEDYWLWPQE